MTRAKSQPPVSKRRVAVLFGGKSAEHEISVISALQALQAIDPERNIITPVYITLEGRWFTGETLLERSFYRKLRLEALQEVTLLPEPSVGGLLPVTPSGSVDRRRSIPLDLCFLLFHGQMGEDGAIQGLLELAELPYTGCGVTASSVAMHKYLCKSILQAHGIPVLPAQLIRRKEMRQGLDQVHRKIEQTAGLQHFPLFIKPCKLGSSIGVGRAEDLRALDGALAKAFRYDDEVMVEPCVQSLIEINVSVLGSNPPRVSPVEVPVSSSGVLTFEDKYLSGGCKEGSGGMASLVRSIDPLTLPLPIKKQAQQYALRAFEILGCAGVGRFDFLLDLATEQLYFNELNPIPGSLAFYLWERERLLYTELIEQLLQQALDRRSEQLALQRQLAFRAL